MSNAVLLADVTSFSIPAAADRYATCARAIGFAKQSDPNDMATEKLIHGLKDLAHALEVPSLREFGIDEHDYFAKIPVMTSQAIASSSPANNPEEAGPEDIERI